VLTAIVLAAAAFVAGLAGAWSPCGFSMVDTLGGSRDHFGSRAVAASCATFAIGASLGGVITFVGLALIGKAVPEPARTSAAVVVAVAIALAAAAADATGARIRPQIRRQVPEPWRRQMPLAVAAGLYGVLLGLGFTTFVLTWAVWALAGVSIALATPALGLAIGLGFGLGRALPVVALAPRYDTLGDELQQKMCERPSWLRGLRLANAGALTLVALVLTLTGTASAAAPKFVTGDGRDLSLSGGLFVWRSSGVAVLQNARHQTRVAVADIAVGDDRIALRAGRTLVVYESSAFTKPVLDPVTGQQIAVPPVAQLVARNVTGLAVSHPWMAWRTTATDGSERLFAVRLASTTRARVVAPARSGEQISRPSLSGNRLVFARTGPQRSMIVAVNLATHRVSRLRSLGRLAQLRAPSVTGHRLVFVQADQCRQRLRIAALRSDAPARTVWTMGSTALRDSGHDGGYTSQGSEAGRCPRGTPRRTSVTLASTALGRRFAYVTLLDAARRGRARSHILAIAVR
jgi:hypothetical protein